MRGISPFPRAKEEQYILQPHPHSSTHTFRWKNIKSSQIVVPFHVCLTVKLLDPIGRSHWTVLKCYVTTTAQNLFSFLCAINYAKNHKNMLSGQKRLGQFQHKTFHTIWDWDKHAANGSKLDKALKIHLKIWKMSSVSCSRSIYNLANHSSLCGPSYFRYYNRICNKAVTAQNEQIKNCF